MTRLGLRAVQRGGGRRRPPPAPPRPGRRRRPGRRPARPATAGRRAPPCGPAGRPRRGPAAGPARRGPPAAPADQAASAGSTPSRRTSTSAIASTGGVRRATTRQRERMVTGTSSGCRLGRAEHDDRARRRLLDHLEHRVRRLLGHPVGVLDEDHLPAALGRRPAGHADELARLGRPDRQPVRDDDVHVGVGAGQHGPAARDTCRHRRRGTAARRRTPGPPPTGPSPGGPVNSQACVMAVGLSIAAAQFGDDRRLADDLRPDAVGGLHRRHGCSCGVEPVWACGWCGARPARGHRSRRRARRPGPAARSAAAAARRAARPPAPGSSRRSRRASAGRRRRGSGRDRPRRARGTSGAPAGGSPATPTRAGRRRLGRGRAPGPPRAAGRAAP